MSAHKVAHVVEGKVDDPCTMVMNHTQTSFDRFRYIRVSFLWSAAPQGGAFEDQGGAGVLSVGKELGAVCAGEYNCCLLPTIHA